MQLNNSKTKLGQGPRGAKWGAVGPGGAGWGWGGVGHGMQLNNSKTTWGRVGPGGAGWG